MNAMVSSLPQLFCFTQCCVLQYICSFFIFQGYVIFHYRLIPQFCIPTLLLMDIKLFPISCYYQQYHHKASYMFTVLVRVLQGNRTNKIAN